MAHRLSVRGDVDALFPAIPEFDGVKISADRDTLIFTSATAVQMDKLKGTLAPIISSVITENYEKRFLSRIINTNYSDFSRKDKKHIFKNVCNGKKTPFGSIITKKLAEYLASSDNLVIDGFVNFRLREYLLELEERVDRAVDSFLVQKEYAEFTALLRYFVEVTPPREAVVNVLATPSGEYMLFGREGRDITGECMKDFSAVIYDEEMNSDDFLLSSLIALAPRKIVLHGKSKFPASEVLATIEEIFENKIEECEGCPLCTKNTGM